LRLLLILTLLHLFHQLQYLLMCRLLTLKSITWAFLEGFHLPLLSFLRVGPRGPCVGLLFLRGIFGNIAYLFAFSAPVAFLNTQQVRRQMTYNCRKLSRILVISLWVYFSTISMTMPRRFFCILLLQLG
jgi:hypothetical protein